jgi:hypothetical protein
VTQFTRMRHEFSVLSMLLGAVFIITFVVAIFIDLAGFLQYVGPEIGAVITAATIFPFLAMGLSISADLNHKVRHK